MTEPLTQARFPVGHYVLGKHQIWLWNDAVQSDQAVGINPGIAIMIALCGSGVSVGELMQNMKAEPQDVLFGELELDFLHDFAVGKTYRIETSIVSTDTKRGMRIPVFDRVKLRYDILDADTAVNVAIVHQVWIVTREKRAP